MSADTKYVPLNPMKETTSSDGDENYLSNKSLIANGDHMSDGRPESPGSKAQEDSIEEDGEYVDKLTFRRAMVLLSMAFLWTASQIPLYFYGGIEPQIIKSIGGESTYVWIALGNLIPLGIVTPFVGALSDLFGRKNIGMGAFAFIIVGNIVSATANSMNVFIIGSTFMGVGAGIGELVSLSVAGEIAPTKNRGIYIGGMIMTILPFCPAVLYAQLITYASSWRWVGLVIGGWSFIGLVLTFVFYWPPPRKSGLSRKELMKQIDYVGGFLSAAGVTLFLVGLTLPTEVGEYTWSDGSVIASLAVGLCCIIAFIVWEWKFAKYPMFPARLKEKNARVLTILLIVTFVSGANFFSVLVFWPGQYQNIYASDHPVSQGVGSLPVGFGIIIGSIIATGLITVLNGNIRILMVVCCMIMTAGNGAMAAAGLNNVGVVYFIVSLACLGVGAVIVPNQVIAGIVCPDDLLATITAATISARIFGGAIAYAIYEDIFTRKFFSLVTTWIGPACYKIGIKDDKQIIFIADILRSGAWSQLTNTPGTAVTTQEQVEILKLAGKETLVAAYPIVYYVSIAFGGIAVVASCFLTGIKEQMGSGVAVRIA